MGAAPRTTATVLQVPSQQLETGGAGGAAGGAAVAAQPVAAVGHHSIMIIPPDKLATDAGPHTRHLQVWHQRCQVGPKMRATLGGAPLRTGSGGRQSELQAHR